MQSQPVDAVPPALPGAPLTTAPLIVLLPFVLLAGLLFAGLRALRAWALDEERRRRHLETVSEGVIVRELFAEHTTGFLKRTGYVAWLCERPDRTPVVVIEQWATVGPSLSLVVRTLEGPRLDAVLEAAHWAGGRDA